MTLPFLTPTLPAVALFLSGCAVVDTGVFQGVRTLPQGGTRWAAGASTGLHLEGANHYKAPSRVAEPGAKPLYSRTVLPDPSLNALFLSTVAGHFGYGLGEGIEVNASAWGGLHGQGIRAGAKLRLPAPGRLAISILPGILHMRTDGGKTQQEEPADGQETAIQHLIYTKAVYGLDLPLALGYPTAAGGEWYFVPAYSFYLLDVSKSYFPQMTGTYPVHRLGLTLGRTAYTSTRRGDFIRPELSLSLLAYRAGAPTVQLNLAFGFGRETPSP